jgi:diguanylate cyclase (GGDEF)-like protein
MTGRSALLWQPDGFYRAIILSAGLLLTIIIGYLHTLSGLAYEFHAFFIVPVLALSWFLGPRFGYALSFLAATTWFVADQMLATDPSALSPLLFNTVVRLIIFLGGAWLVGEIRRALLRESRLAREDALTKMPNRREFHERGRHIFAQAQRQGSAFTAVFIDLDRFKEVNDALGHNVGDQLLVAVAKTMLEHVRDSDIPGRLGGDEFALLLPNMNASAANAYVHDLRCRLLDSMQARGWPVTFSIGVASYRLAPASFDTLLRQADSLMYEVKHSSRNRVLLGEY